MQCGDQHLRSLNAERINLWSILLADARTSQAGWGLVQSGYLADFIGSYAQALRVHVVDAVTTVLPGLRHDIRADGHV